MKITLTTLVLAVGAAALSGPPVLAQEITGAGATFPAPVYAKWGEAAKAATGVQLSYQAIGSGGGESQIINRAADFGASDAPVDGPKLAANNLLQFPMVVGAVVPIVNLPGMGANRVKLTGELLADIYMGKISKWNDPKLVEMNRGVAMPNLAIAPVYRAEVSGTSYVFTSYLSSASSDWRERVGAKVSVKWPAGAGARGNDGVAGMVRSTRGGIGYVANAYATQNHLTTIQLRNKAGQFVGPTMASFAAAVAGGNWAGAQNFAVDLIDQPGATTWPIVSATYLLVPKDPKDGARMALVLKFVDWAYTNGGQIATDLEYIPVPKAVQDSVRATWKTSIMAAGEPVYK